MAKVALVTGAGTGIGKSAALALLKDGYSVALVGRRKELLEKAAADSGAKDRCLVLAADLAKPDEVKRVFQELKQKWSRLDVLFNNAGMGAPAIPMALVGWPPPAPTCPSWRCLPAAPASLSPRSAGGRSASRRQFMQP